MRPSDHPTVAEHDIPIEAINAFDFMLKGNNSSRPLDGTTGDLSFSYGEYHKIIKVNGTVSYTKG